MQAMANFSQAPQTLHAALSWDVFCQVVDNWGDLGVCWRLACNLAARGQRVRLWVDDPTPLQWMAPQGCVGVELRHWPARAGDVPVQGVGDVVVEAFGTEYATNFIASYAINTRASGQFGSKNNATEHPSPVWINLEYLSAESYVERSHGLPSPILHGPAQGFTRWFFYPGFTAQTGGLLRESDLPQRQAAFKREAWLAEKGLPPAREGEQFISLFCYESPALPALLAQLAQSPHKTRLLVTHGRAAQAVKTCLSTDFLSQIGHWPAYSLRKQLSNSEQLDSVQLGQLHLHWLPPLTQHDFDHLLWACDMNIVRGEDSLVRALWAGKPFAWHIYPQSDGAHAAKLAAFLDWLGAPPALRAFHSVWNGLQESPHRLAVPLLQPGFAQAARERLLAQSNLADQLLGFVDKKRRS
jgi:uncharacterized repeat protein (TIGR03837 family)